MARLTPPSLLQSPNTLEQLGYSRSEQQRLRSPQPNRFDVTPSPTPQPSARDLLQSKSKRPTSLLIPNTADLDPMDHNGLDGNNDLAAPNNHLPHSDLNQALVPRSLAAAHNIVHMVRSPVFEVRDEAAVGLEQRADSHGAPMHLLIQVSSQLDRRTQQLEECMVQLRESHDQVRERNGQLAWAHNAYGELVARMTEKDTEIQSLRDQKQQYEAAVPQYQGAIYKLHEVIQARETENAELRLQSREKQKIINQRDEDLRIAQGQESPAVGPVRTLKFRGPVKTTKNGKKQLPPSYILEVLVPDDEAASEDVANYFKWIGLKVVTCDDHMIPDEILHSIGKTLKNKAARVPREEVKFIFKVSKLERAGSFEPVRDLATVIEWVGRVKAMGLVADKQDSCSPVLRAYAFDNEDIGGAARTAWYCDMD